MPGPGARVGFASLPVFSVGVIGGAWLLAPEASWSGGLIAALALFLAWWEPAWVLVLMALVAPFEQPALINGFTLYTTEVVLVCACAGAAWHWGRHKAWRRPVVKVYGWAVPFAAVVVFSALGAQHAAAWKGAVRWMEWITVLLLSVHLLRRGRDAQRVWVALAVAGTVSACVGLAQVWQGPAAHPNLGTLQWAQREIVRAAGEYGANTLALLLALILPWMLSEIFWPRRRLTQGLAMFGALLMLSAWVLTFSGTGLLALGVAGVIMGWAYVHRCQWNPLWLVGVLALGLVVLAVTHQGWLDATFLKYKLTTLQDRLDYLAVAGRLFQSAPWLGIGPGMYRWLAPTWGGGVNPVGVITHPHNLYLTILVELGAVGLALCLAALFRLVRHLARRADRLPALKEYVTVWACTAGIGGVAVANLLDHGLIHDRGVHVALWIGATLVWAQRPPRPRSERRQRFEHVWQSQAHSATADWEARLAERRSGRVPLYALAEGVMPVTEPCEVLELGCGPALDALNLAAHSAWRVQGVDFSQTALAQAAEGARLLQRRLTLHCADVRRTGLPGGRFDLVYSQGLLEHFPDPEPVWREMQRLTKPGGFVLVDVPQTWNPYTLAKLWHRVKGDWPWGWERQYTRGELIRAGAEHGLTWVRTAGYGYRRGPLDVTYALRQWLRPKAPALWDRWEQDYGAYWMMNVVVVFRKA